MPLWAFLLKLAHKNLQPLSWFFYRSFFGLITIFAFTKACRLPLATPLLGKQLRRAVTGFISLLLFFYAISELPLATAVTLNYTSPLFMAIWGETLSPDRWLAVGLIILSGIISVRATPR